MHPTSSSCQASYNEREPVAAWPSGNQGPGLDVQKPQNGIYTSGPGVIVRPVLKVLLLDVSSESLLT